MLLLRWFIYSCHPVISFLSDFVNTGHCITCWSTWCLATSVSLCARQDNASDRVIILAVAKAASVLPQGGPGSAIGEDILTSGDHSDDYKRMNRWNSELRHHRGHQGRGRVSGGWCLYWFNFVLVNFKTKRQLIYCKMRLCLLQVWRWHNWRSLSARSPPGVI